MLRSYRSAVIAVGLILLPSLGMGQSPENRGPDQSVEQQPADAETAQEPAVEAKIVVEPTTAPTHPTAEEHDTGGADERGDQPEQYFVWGDTPAQWFMAASGALALAVSVWAVWLLRKTLIETHRATEAALMAADAADAAVDGTRKMGQRELRAYVNFIRIETITTMDQLREDRPRKVHGYEFRVTVENAGATPAIDCRIYGGHRLVDVEGFQPLVFDKADDDRNLTAIGPHSMVYGPPRYISREEAQRMLERKSRLILWWRAEYRDIFDHSPARFVEKSWEALVGENPEVLQPGDALPSFRFMTFGRQILN